LQYNIKFTFVEKINTGKKKVKPYDVLPLEPMVVEKPFVMFETLKLDESKIVGAYF